MWQELLLMRVRAMEPKYVCGMAICVGWHLASARQVLPWRAPKEALLPEGLSQGAVKLPEGATHVTWAT